MHLTPKEKLILQCIQTGMTNKEIAKAHSISVYTVRDHVCRMLLKAGARNRVVLATFAINSDVPKLIPPPTHD